MNNIENKFAIPFGDFANRLLTAVNKSKSLTGRLDVEDVNPELGMAVFVVKMLGVDTCKARFSFFKLDEMTTQCVVQFSDWPLSTWDNFGNRKLIEKHIKKSKNIL